MKTENLDSNLKSTKMLLLHTSFETCVDANVLESWDRAIAGLQSKRYKI